MKNQIQLSAEMLEKILKIAQPAEIYFSESPVGPVSISLKKIRFEGNQFSVPMKIQNTGIGEILVSVKIENGICLDLETQ